MFIDNSKKKKPGPKSIMKKQVKIVKMEIEE